MNRPFLWYNIANGDALNSAMDYTLENLKNIVLKRIQDEEFDVELLTQFLNDSLFDILGEDKYPFMQRIETYGAESYGEINLPPGYSSTFYIYAKKDKEPRQELKYVQPELFFRNTQAHTFSYTVFANTLFYNLENDKDAEDFEIEHLYLANPRPLVKDTDRPPIPPEYMEALILGAMARVEEVRDNFDFSQIFRNQQAQILTNMKARLGPGNVSLQNRAQLPFYGGYYYGDE